MKYVNKEACVEQRAVQNVIEEVELLREVDHPFVVSLWYTFQVDLNFLFYFSVIYLLHRQRQSNNLFFFFILTGR